MDANVVTAQCDSSSSSGLGAISLSTPRHLHKGRKSDSVLRNGEWHLILKVYFQMRSTQPDLNVKQTCADVGEMSSGSGQTTVSRTVLDVRKKAKADLLQH